MLLEVLVFAVVEVPGAGPVLSVDELVAAVAVLVLSVAVAAVAVAVAVEPKKIEDVIVAAAVVAVAVALDVLVVDFFRRALVAFYEYLNEVF